MSEQGTMAVAAPVLPKGGGAIQSIGKGFGTVGARGSASYEIALPISPGRGFAPDLSLSYTSSVGNSEFGIGWGLSLPVVARRTSKGVPAYADDDEIIGPGGVVWMPEQGAQGTLTTTVRHYNDLQLDTAHTVIRHFPRLEKNFDRIEHWSSKNDRPGFWLVHGADGSLHLFGRQPASRRADPEDANRVAEWLLEESINPHGEHILYQYAADKAQRYLSKVSYGNFKADAHLYLWKPDQLDTLQWHFELVFDYGERSTNYQDKPAYTGQQWLTRSDAFSSFAYGYEICTERLCRQVLMFHRFPAELGNDPVLARRLLIEYRPTALGYQQLSSAHEQAYGASATAENHPPMEFTYSHFELSAAASNWQPFHNMPDINDGQRYQWVDLYGEGLAGLLLRNGPGWYYREPIRGKANSDEVAYDQLRVVPTLPTAASAKKNFQSLGDLTGDGRLDLLTAEPKLSGFFSLNAERQWSGFATFDAFPIEFFQRKGQLADLMGAGLSDLAMIGPRSVRLYANRREKGFAPAIEVPREKDQDNLPVLTSSPGELIAFSDMLGSGQQHLVRIRHDEVKCWPNLGRGRFGKGRVLGSPGLAYEAFDASRVRLADLDGSGSTDLIYLESRHALIFMNRSGSGFSPPVKLPWPEGVRFDGLCQVSFDNLLGLGCSSLILSTPHTTPRHWRYDFVSAKPYLLIGANNNMGAANSICYRSSAQEWLDEKVEKIDAGKPPICHVPFAMHVVSETAQLDEITGNRLMQTFSYRQGYYDGVEREFRGFGLLLQLDSESHPGDASMEGLTTPCLTKSWFHTGQAVDMSSDGFDETDKHATHPGRALLCQYQTTTNSDAAIASPDPATTLEMARAQSGHLLRTEVLAVEPNLGTRTLYSVQENRYRVRLLQAAQGKHHYARMLPSVLESISYQYEGISDDPQCQHTFNLRHDQYGAVIHSLSVNCARRTTAADPPPFSDSDQQQWWRDAHDPAQQFYYLSESRAEFIHLDTPQGWRLGLPYRQRTQAQKRPKSPEYGGLSAQALTYEKVLDWVSESTWANQSDLTGLSLQRYQHTTTGETLEDGVAHFEALADFLQTAELDETALSAFDVLPQESRPTAALLSQLGYQRMTDFFSESTPARKFWSIKSSFATYATLAGHFKIRRFQPSKSHGVTEVFYDKYHCMTTEFRLPDGCTTKATYDYRSFVPLRIVDPNGNVQEARYDNFGRLLCSTFYGTAGNIPVGFKPISEYQRPDFITPDDAIADAKAALQKTANATFVAPFSWMGCVSKAAIKEADWLARCITNGDLLHGGFICNRGRDRLAGLADVSADDKKLKLEIDKSPREPVHAATLSADRFPNDMQQQIRISVTCLDGFGRTLQSKQLVEPGLAYTVNATGGLTQENEKPLEQVAAMRWRTSERVEYNNKGLVIRTYRPYFANHSKYINDVALRQFGHYDLQFYDALGRPTRTRLAGEASFMRRQTRHPWYTIEEDENDTLEAISPKTPATSGGDA
ncbi:SpvB/TcaC N-terminal domain-containing protein [Pseudomonas sp. TMB3-21]